MNVKCTCEEAKQTHDKKSSKNIEVLHSKNHKLHLHREGECQRGIKVVIGCFDYGLCFKK